MGSGRYLPVNKGGYLAARHIVHTQPYMRLLGQLVGDNGARVERVGVVLIEGDLRGQIVLFVEASLGED